jgi:hypothetical protein
LQRWSRLDNPKLRNDLPLSNRLTPGLPLHGLPADPDRHSIQ